MSDDEDCGAGNCETDRCHQIPVEMSNNEECEAGGCETHFRHQILAEMSDKTCDKEIY